jgi:hypothetical protein
MDINRAAPAIASGEAFIDADPKTVFSVISAIGAWPSWNPDVKSAELDGPVEPGTGFRWKAGASSLTSTLQVVDPPHEIAWTGDGNQGNPRLPLRGARGRHPGSLGGVLGGTHRQAAQERSRKTLQKGIDDVLSHLKAESERRVAPA